MRESLPLLANSDFPAIRRGQLETLQVNLGYLCNQSCLHCHVNAGPTRKELMDESTVDLVVDFLRVRGLKTLDVTGGAPEMNPHFRKLVVGARALGVEVIDRCNLTILSEPGYEDMAEFLAVNRVHVVASLPCYLEDNVNTQRGPGAYRASIEGIRKLNQLGYAAPRSALALDLVYNPQGAQLPPPQAALEADYKRELRSRFAIEFNRLLTITNLPIGRFGSVLQSKGLFDGYLELLKRSFSRMNLSAVMCRSLISVDWRGYVYDCDFNQMLDLPMLADEHAGRVHLRDLTDVALSGRPIRVLDHCYGCTAGQGSSCGGALVESVVADGLVA